MAKSTNKKRKLIVESNGESTIKSWMESFRFDGDKINFINMYSKQITKKGLKLGPFLFHFSIYQ